MGKLTRREVLISSARLASAATGALLCDQGPVGQACPRRKRVPQKSTPGRTKRVAALVTEYRRNSHADVILGKILEGYRHDRGPGPALELAGMYVDQFPKADLSRVMSRKHNIPIFSTIEDAVTLGQKTIPVDGVLI